MMRLLLERKTQLEQELEQAEQAVANWEELLAKLHLGLPEASGLRDDSSSSVVLLND